MTISVIIPTCNRQELLLELLNNLEKYKEIQEVIVVDSSNIEISYLPRSNFVLKYFHTAIKSAAQQRNIGIENIDKMSKYLFFLDDDTCPSDNYFTELVRSFEDESLVGVSGIAIPKPERKERKRPMRFHRLYHRFFLLDSIHDGKVLKSGVNIPVRSKTSNKVIVDWLIGCSCWKINAIENTRFEYDFFGVSLAEDVVFSMRMKKKGNLVVNPRVHLIHFESAIDRIYNGSYWKMWMVNRRRVIEISDSGVFGVLAYWWATLGQSIILGLSDLRFLRRSNSSFIGLLRGAKQVLRGRSEN